MMNGSETIERWGKHVNSKGLPVVPPCFLGDQRPLGFSSGKICTPLKDLALALYKLNVSFSYCRWTVIIVDFEYNAPALISGGNSTYVEKMVDLPSTMVIYRHSHPGCITSCWNFGYQKRPQTKDQFFGQPPRRLGNQPIWWSIILSHARYQPTVRLNHEPFVRLQNDDGSSSWFKTSI